MTLRPYSTRPARLLLQLLADVSLLAWVYAWYRVGRFVHDAIDRVAGLGYSVRAGAEGVGSNLREAGDRAAGVPLVGDQLGAPLRAAGGSVGDVATAGQGAGDTVARLATPTGLLVAAGPVLSVLVVWLVLRLRFARRAGAAAELSTTPAGQDLLALRALSGRPLHQLTGIAPDPAQAWRRGDPDVVRALGALELRACGLPPRSAPAALPVGSGEAVGSVGAGGPGGSVGPGGSAGASGAG